MWRAQVEAQVRLPVDGEAMEVQGRISVYEAGGQYQLYADVLGPQASARHLDFIRLRKSWRPKACSTLIENKRCPIARG